MGQEKIWCWRYWFKLVYCIEGNKWCLNDFVKTFFLVLYVSMHSDIYELIYFKLMWWQILLNSTFWHVLIDLNSRSQGWKKANTSAPIISQSFESVWMEFAIVLRLVGLMNLIFIIIISYDQYSRERTLLLRIVQTLWHCLLLQSDFFQTLFDKRDPWIWHFDTSLDNFDLHSRSVIWK